MEGIARDELFLQEWLKMLKAFKNDEEFALRRELPGDMALHIAAYTGIPPLVESIFEQGGNFSEKDKGDALWIAAEGGHEGAVQVLLENEVKINIKNWYKATALTVAAKNGHESVVRLLIKSKADIGTKDRFGGTPLHYAVDGMDEAVTRLLISEGANPSATAKYGRTPLHMAAAGADQALNRLLIQKTGGGCGVGSFTSVAVED
jgi:ankyrin repeat protein